MELSYEEEMINERHLSACDLREYFVKEKFLVSSETEVERITTDDEPLFCQRKGRRRRLRREKKKLTCRPHERQLTADRQMSVTDLAPIRGGQ